MLNEKLLRKFLLIAGDTLCGNWVIIGGTVLPLLGIHYRVTVDIDIVGPKDADLSQTLALIEIADKLGLPVEIINQAGAYFFYKIEDRDKLLVLLHKGKRATIFRPNVTLFILLKLTRLTESDLTDCFEFLKFATQNNEHADLERLKKEIKRHLNVYPRPEKQDRLKILLDEISHYEL